MSERPKPTWRKKLAISTTTFVVASLLAWGGSVVVRARDLYEVAKSEPRGWKGRIYRSDAQMGLAAIPSARAEETFAAGPGIPSRIDARGFRVPTDADESAPITRPIFLALGCSFTFGAAEPAENAFAYKVAQHFHGTCLNAGVCSGGAAQQWILARKLIPLHTPDYVLLQYSPWLVERSLAEYAPTYIGTIPTPYFVRTGAGVELAPPAFETLAFDVPIAEYRESPRGFVDFVGFLTRVGAPLLVHDDVCLRRLAFSRWIGALPKIAAASDVDALVYPEIARLCAEHGSKLVIVGLENGSVPWRVPEVIGQLDVPIAYATNRLRDRLPELTRDAYHRAYLHMAGDPPVLIDAHPNAAAHAIIAETIIEAIEAGP